MIQTSTSFIGIIIGSYGISQMVLRLPVGLLANYRNKHKMIMLIGSLSSGCASLFRIIFNNGIGFLIGNLFSVFASAMWISFMVLYMSFYPKDQQTKAISSIIVANNLGMLLEFITSTLLYEKIGMQMICLLSVIACGVEPFDAFNAVLASINNLGPGLGSVSSNMTAMPDSAKWVLTIAMVCGRLEIFTLLALFTPTFWKA